MGGGLRVDPEPLVGMGEEKGWGGGFTPKDGGTKGTDQMRDEMRQRAGRPRLDGRPGFKEAFATVLPRLRRREIRQCTVCHGVPCFGSTPWMETPHH